MTHDRHNHLPAPARMTDGTTYTPSPSSSGAYSTRCGICNHPISLRAVRVSKLWGRACKDIPACKARKGAKP